MMAVRITLAGLAVAAVYSIFTIGSLIYAEKHGVPQDVSVRYGVFGVEPACAPGYAGRIDRSGLTWCDRRGGDQP